MREVERRLSQPDTGEETRKKQEQIVKRIETLIEQARTSSQSQRRQRQNRPMKPGEQPGEPQDQPGENGGNAPFTKAAKPENKRSTAGGKDAWGHLPPELRQEMDNVFKEDPLPSREELIRRYYLSVSQEEPGPREVIAVDRNRWASSMFRALLAAGLTIAGALRRSARAEDPKPSDKKEASGFVDGRKGDVPEGAAELVTPQTEHAIKVGLTWLTKNQNADGSFGSGTYRGNIAVTSLAGLAFMASGSSPGRGPYGSYIDKALAYVMENTSPSGFIAVPSAATHGPMYSHGFGDAVSRRSVRDDASARDSREASESRSD